MIVLAAETSTRLGSVALRRHGELVGQRASEPAKGHGGGLIAEIDRLLGDAGIGPAQVDLFVASAGPGSFTGVRVGLSTMTALAWAVGRRATALDSLRVLAENAGPGPGLVCPVLDARKQEVYGALYRREDGGAMREVIAAGVLSPDRWRDIVGDAAGTAPVRFLGTGVTAYPDHFADSGLYPHLRAEAMAELAERLAMRDGLVALPPAAPRYVRPSHAEVKFGLAPDHAPLESLTDPG